MPKFTVIKEDNFTTMSNYVLRDTNLSLKAIGLMCKMLSLPPTWDYSMKGLVSICKEEETAVSTALNELKKYGYLTVKKIRDEKGRIKDVEYSIYEQPFLNPDFHPNLENPNMDNPKTENQVQLNIDLNNLNNLNKYKSNLINQKEKIRSEKNSIFLFEEVDPNENLEELIKNNIEYDILYEDQKNQSALDAILFVMTEVLSYNQPYITIAKKKLPTYKVQQIFRKINTRHILYVIESLKTTTTEVKNINAYLKATIYNSYNLCELHINSEVQHLMAQT